MMSHWKLRYPTTGSRMIQAMGHWPSRYNRCTRTGSCWKMGKMPRLKGRARSGIRIMQACKQANSYRMATVKWILRPSHGTLTTITRTPITKSWVCHPWERTSSKTGTRTPPKTLKGSCWWTIRSSKAPIANSKFSRLTWTSNEKLSWTKCSSIKTSCACLDKETSCRMYHNRICFQALTVAKRARTWVQSILWRSTNNTCSQLRRHWWRRVDLIWRAARQPTQL